MGRKKKPRAAATPDDEAAAIHKAFRRMAFIFANLVCGIWLVLLLVTAAVDETPPDWAFLAVLLVIGAPLAYAVPYALVRMIGRAVIAVRAGRRG